MAFDSGRDDFFYRVWRDVRGGVLAVRVPAHGAVK